MNKRKVQAIVLAGGFGTRLFPLTDAKPKPLVKIVNKTVLDMVMEAVFRTEAAKITLSTCHFSSMIEKECRKYPKQVECIKEETPLGTAGGVKNCVKEDFDAYLVVSGDGVFDFDLQNVIDKHFEKEPYATIVCTNKSDPTEFGTIRCTEDGKIYEINEKPAWKNVKTDLVNTGIYVLSKKAVSMIPDGVLYDFSKQLFKELLNKNLSLLAVTPEGFWCDIGTLEEYKNCNIAAISQQINSDAFKDIRQKAKDGFEITADSYVYENAVVGKNTNIKDKSIVCKNVSIGENCEICDSIVSQDSVIGKGCGIYGAIVGENVTVGENCIISEGCVLGDNCSIKDWSVLKKGTLVKSSAVVYREDCEKMNDKGIKKAFVDDGICVFCNKNSFEEVSLTASAMTASFEKNDGRPARICVASDSKSAAFKSAFMAGAMRMGAQITELEKCDENILSFCSCFLPEDAFVYIQNDNEGIKISILERNGKKLCDEKERKIIKNLEKISGDLQNGFNEQNNERFFSQDVNHIDVLPVYFSFLEELCENMGLDAKSEKPRINISEDKKTNTPSLEIFKRVLARFGFEFYYGVDNIHKISFSKDVDECFVRYEDTLIDKNHIEALVLNNLESIEAKGVKLSENSPRVLHNLAHSKSTFENENRKLCMFELVENDACVLLLSLLCICTKRKKNIEQLLCEIPPFQVYSEMLVADVNRAGTMKKLEHLYKACDTYCGDGINLTLSRGNVTIIPSRSNGFKIVSEAANMETAKELYFDIEKIIKEKS